MRVLLINQPWICTDKEYGLRSGVRWAMIRKRDRSMPYYAFPFPLAYAASYLRSKGIDSELRDSLALEESKEDALHYIAKEQFDVIVVETSTASISYDMAFCDAVKERCPGTLLCAAGQHSTALPDEVLSQSSVDVVLIGEYERSLHQVVDCLQRGTSWAHVPGISYRSLSRAVVNNGRAAPLSMDELPPPYRDKALIGKYNEPASRYYPNLPMMTSRGCSFKCTFCVEATLNYGPKSTFRYRSLDKVIEEMRVLVDEYGIREIFFDDAFFTSRRAEDVANAILKSGLSVHWSCWIDRTVSEETLRLMKRSGCSSVKFGVETFDERIGSNARKHVFPAIVKTLVERCHRVGLLTHATYVFGLPGETPETLEHTLQTAMALGTSSTQFSIATPLPGTEFFNQAKANGWLTTFDWSKYEGQSSAVLKYDRLTPRDLENAMVRVRKLKMLRLLRQPKLLVLFVIKMIRMMGVRKFLNDITQKSLFMVKG